MKIKKINAHTIKVKDEILSLNTMTNIDKRIGTDYYSCYCRASSSVDKNQEKMK